MLDFLCGRKGRGGKKHNIRIFQGQRPQIDSSAFIDPTAVIIGKVSIGRNVFVGPGAVVRADEPGSSIIIQDGCNVQDRVIVHALGRTAVVVDEGTSLSHGCIIHGPCKIGKRCFIGFGSVVFRAEIGDGVCVKHLTVVENANILSEKKVDSNQRISGEESPECLCCVDGETRAFMDNVAKANLDLVGGYKNE